jgi:hypothetical protein|tara:strand:+ start:697 stop:1014 length:318 start_codon:yes stop_codon:yes gene_type:complete
MKKSKLISKVSRYLVLSKEFEQVEEELFEDRAVDASSLSLTSSGSVSYIGGCGSVSLQNIVIEAKTRAEVILDKAKSESDRSNRYDEYKKLQTNLSKYFKTIKEL